MTIALGRRRTCIYKNCKELEEEKTNAAYVQCISFPFHNAVWGGASMQLSVCAQFISFAVELFPTAANNAASRRPDRIGRPPCVLPYFFVLQDPLAPKSPPISMSPSKPPPHMPQHTFPLNLLAGGSCLRCIVS